MDSTKPGDHMGNSIFARRRREGDSPLPAVFFRPNRPPRHALYLTRHCPLIDGLSGSFLEGYYR